MSQIVLTESELKLRMAQIYKEEKLNQMKSIWETFTKNEKLFVFEFYKQLHPESKLLSEGKWYNWIGDIVGFIPGLEIVNVINGVSYWRQGDKLFALLSFLAGLPGLNLILNPVKGLLKGGGALARGLKGAVALGDSTKLASLGSKSGIIGKLIRTVGDWGGKLMGVLLKIGERVPFLKNVIKGIRGTVETFKGASAKMLSGGGNALKNVSKIDNPALNVKKGIGGNVGDNDPFSNALSSMLGK